MNKQVKGLEKSMLDKQLVVIIRLWQAINSVDVTFSLEPKGQEAVKKMLCREGVGNSCEYTNLKGHLKNRIRNK